MSENQKYLSRNEWNSLSDEEKNRIICEIRDTYSKLGVQRNGRIKVKVSFYTKYGKRMLDISISLLALIVTLPLNLFIMIITFFDVGSPIIFKQERIGKDGKQFNIYKFRNMTNEKDENGNLLPPTQRVTAWGRFVRKTSLDELLNFWSILKGDMSIIGPRPLLKQYLNRYNSFHMQRHLVKPGLECPFHDSSLAKLGWDGRFENDIWYVENLSFSTDIKMFFLLIKKVLSKKERSESANGEVGEFLGYDVKMKVIDETNIPIEYINNSKAVELV